MGNPGFSPRHSGNWGGGVMDRGEGQEQSETQRTVVESGVSGVKSRACVKRRVLTVHSANQATDDPGVTPGLAAATRGPTCNCTGSWLPANTVFRAFPDVHTHHVLTRGAHTLWLRFTFF